MKDTIKLVKKAEDAIIKHFESRLGCYGVRGYKLEIKETPRLTYDYSVEQVLEPNALGIFRHALKKCTFSAEVWGIKKEENEVGQRWLVEGGLSYEHTDGCSNGCDLDIKFYINDEGTITEVYK